MFYRLGEGIANIEFNKNAARGYGPFSTLSAPSSSIPGLPARVAVTSITASTPSQVPERLPPLASLSASKRHAWWACRYASAKNTSHTPARRSTNVLTCVLFAEIHVLRFDRQSPSLRHRIARVQYHRASRLAHRYENRGPPPEANHSGGSSGTRRACGIHERRRNAFR
jgi:hypothetical protein